MGAGGLFASRKPSSRIPVPASSTIVLPSSRRSSTLEVLPPYARVAGPGVAREPRQPQIVAIISPPSWALRVGSDRATANDTSAEVGYSLPQTSALSR
jgi:hypothetical protein